MSVLEDVKKMQQQGMSEEKIIQTMRERGVSYKDIANALSQSRIKAAVEQPNNEPEYAGAISPEGMIPSMMNQQEQQIPEPKPLEYPQMQQPENFPVAPIPGGGYPIQEQREYEQFYDYNQQYSYNQPQQASPDIITEISEQVVSEKLSEIRKHLEKIIEMKTIFESKIESLDERIKKIEKIIDTLQTSVLRKVGDYVTNINDIKTELIETQKSFAKLLSAPIKERLQNRTDKSNQNYINRNRAHRTQNEHNKQKNKE